MPSGLHAQVVAFEVLRMLPTDGRAEAALVRVPGHDVPRVVRVVSDGADAERFLAVCERLSTLPHPALLPVVGFGRLDDRRAYVLTPEPAWEPLERLTALPAGAGALFAPVADALATLHAAGLTLGGAISPAQLFFGAAAHLDASLAGLAEVGSTPEHDVRALVSTLSGYGLPFGDAPGAAPGQGGQAFTDARLLAEFLADAQGEWRSRTAVSGKYPRLVLQNAEADLTGAMLGAWRLERVLGEGAMGKVYLGRHARIGREAAVKVLKAEHAKQADSLQRFIQEATAVNAIKNEHIVEISDFGEQPAADGSTIVYCVMELLEGRSLTAAMSAEPFSVARAARVAHALSTALDAAHRVGVVHRDVKPDNIFLQAKGPDGQFVKVLDFGVANLLKPLGDLPVASTQAGMVIGTPDYMAPEQALGAPTDFRVDLWAVGVVLYEMLTGRRPFTGDTFQELLIELATKEPAPLGGSTRGAEAIPQRVQDIVAWCLARKPADRPPSGEALAAALAPFTQPDRLRQTTTPLPYAGPVTVAPISLTAVAPAAPRAPSRRGLLFAGAAVSVAVLGLTARFLLGHGAGRSAQVAEQLSAPAAAALQPVAPPPSSMIRPPVPTKPAAAISWLDVTTSPAAATVRDRQTNLVLGSTPMRVALPPQATLALAIDLEGHRTVVRDVAFNADAVLDLTLEPLLRKKPAVAQKALAPKKLHEKKGAVARDRIVDPFKR